MAGKHAKPYEYTLDELHAEWAGEEVNGRSWDTVGPGQHVLDVGTEPCS